MYATSGNGGPATLVNRCRPTSIDFSGTGLLAVLDFDCQSIRVIDSAGTINPFAGVGTIGFSGDLGAARDASLYFANQLAFSANSALLYVVDSGNDRLRVVGPSVRPSRVLP